MRLDDYHCIICLQYSLSCIFQLYNLSKDHFWGLWPLKHLVQLNFYLKHVIALKFVGSSVLKMVFSIFCVLNLKLRIRKILLYFFRHCIDRLTWDFQGVLDIYFQIFVDTGVPLLYFGRMLCCRSLFLLIATTTRIFAVLSVISGITNELIEDQLFVSLFTSVVVVLW